MTTSSTREGVDSGGTFTGVTLQHPDRICTCKVLTNHDQPEHAKADFGFDEQ